MDRRKFKLACNVIFRNQNRAKWNSSLNGRPSDYKYNAIDQKGEHFATAWGLFEELKFQQPGLAISKLYESTSRGKGPTVENASVVFHELPDAYQVYLIIGTEIIPAQLDTQGVSARARTHGVLATKVLKNHTQKPVNAVEMMYGKKD